MYFNEAVANAFIAACDDELLAFKPGNVHVYAAGHDMTVNDFRLAARSSASFIASNNRYIGERVYAAVKSSLDATGRNVNLGIVLLCAPLAYAFEKRNCDSSLRSSLTRSLNHLTDADASKIYAAIAHANPGGLGDKGDADVRNAPSLSLLDAMALASGHDRIAYAYVSNFEDIFEIALPYFTGALERKLNRKIAITELYLYLLVNFPDSHIGRKYGVGLAKTIQQEANEIYQDIVSADQTYAVEVLTKFDRSLKNRNINPGTTADLTVATLFTHKLERLLGKYSDSCEHP